MLCDDSAAINAETVNVDSDAEHNGALVRLSVRASLNAKARFLLVRLGPELSSPVSCSKTLNSIRLRNCR